MKIALLYPDDFSFWLFRQKLLSTLVAEGHDVVIICRDTGYVNELIKLGVRHVEAPFERFMSAKGDLKLFWSLLKIFKNEAPDIIHNFTIKPNVYGSIAGWIIGCKTILNSVTGLGFIGDTSESPQTFKQRLGKTLYYFASMIATRTWFQNPDDINFFVINNLIKPNKCILIKSSGINLQEWNPADVSQNSIQDIRNELKISSDDIFIVMVSRVLKSKGVFDYVDAARIVKRQERRAKFILVGNQEDRGNDAISTQILESWNDENIIRWIGQRSDIKQILAASDISVLPSYYPEGVPRSLLEAMAMRKPIITTTAPGCKEVVQEGVNGLLVPPKNAQALADAIIRLCQNQALRSNMGVESRKKAHAEFDEAIVVSRLISELYLFKPSAQGIDKESVRA